MQGKLISVIVPAYNREKYLGAALDSIVSQNYRPIEIMVVDDGSTDGTASVARSYPDVHYIYQKNQGPVVARNTGLANCTGELVSFLDADDYWPPNKLRIQSDYLAAHPELGCVIGKSRNFLEDGMTRPRWISEDMMTEDGGGWTLGSSLAHRWVFDRVGHLNVLFPYGDDLEWCIRVREAGIPLFFMSEVLLHRRIHTSNISEDQNALARDRVRLVKAYMDRKRGKFAKPMAGSSLTNWSKGAGQVDQFGETKLISVIVPAYNNEKYLAAAVDSIVAQDYRPIEAVVVDDGSTDATASIARSYPEVRYVYQAHQGLPVARNTGIANCMGELICFLDADDYWPPNKLRIQSAYLAAHPELGCVIGKLLNFLEDGMTRPDWISEPLMTEEGGGWSLGASLVQRWVFDRIGSFNVLYSYCDDLDWLIRLAEAKIPWEVLPGVFLHRRIHANNMSKDRDAVTRAEFRIMKAHMDRKRGKVAEPLPGDRQ